MGQQGNSPFIDGQLPQRQQAVADTGPLRPPAPLLQRPHRQRRVHQAGVSPQLAQLLRHAVGRQIGGRCHQMARHLTDAPADEAGVFQRRRPQRQIVTLPHQIELLIAEGQLQHHLGIEGPKLGQDPAEQQGAGRLRRGDPHPPGRGCAQPRHRQIGAAGQRQQRPALLHIDLSLRGQAQPAGGALQQAHPELGLEPRDLLADRGFGHAKQLGRPGKTALLHHGGKQPHQLQFDIVHIFKQSLPITHLNLNNQPD